MEPPFPNSRNAEIAFSYWRYENNGKSLRSIWKRFFSKSHTLVSNNLVRQKLDTEHLKCFLSDNCSRRRDAVVYAPVDVISRNYRVERVLVMDSTREKHIVSTVKSLRESVYAEYPEIKSSTV